MHDLSPATAMLSRLVADTRDDQLGAPTPCGGVTVADLLHHVDGLSRVFTAAAEKDPAAAGQAAAPDGSLLPADWRARIPERLAALAVAWQSESAWTGVTRAGGVEMPGEVAANVAINEVLVHGWDLAVATGHDFAAEPDLVAAAMAFVAPTARQNPDGVPGLFGPPVTIPDDLPALDHLVGMTGRDPAWQPS
jgi:uncharacterized protein (TIGR03086 family)